MISAPSLPIVSKLTSSLWLGISGYFSVLCLGLYWLWPSRQSTEVAYAQLLALTFAFPFVVLLWLATQKRLQFGWLTFVHALVAIGLSAFFSLLLSNSLTLPLSALWVYAILVASLVASGVSIVLSAITRSKPMPIPSYRIILVLTIMFAAGLLYQGHMLPAGRLPSATPAQNEATTDTTDLTAIDIIEVVNRQRTQAGIASLATSPQLMQAASKFVQQAATSSAAFDSLKNNTKIKETYATEAGYLVKEIADIVAVTDPHYPANMLIKELLQDPKIQAIFYDRQITDLGVGVLPAKFNKSETIVYLLIANQKAKPTSTPRPTPTPASRSAKFTGVDLFAAVNQSRKEHGVPELRQRNELCTVASIRLNQQLEKGHIDNHEGFDAVLKKYEDQLQDYSHVAENLAEGYETAPATVKAWEGSPGHLVLLKDGSYTFGCTAANSSFSVLIAAY